MITVRRKQLIDKSTDSKFEYGTCRGNSPSEAYEWKTVDYSYREDPSTFTYRPSEKNEWKIPHTATPTDRFSPKPYRVGYYEITRSHSVGLKESYQRSAKAILVRNYFDKGNPEIWVDDVCNASYKWITYYEKFVKERVCGRPPGMEDIVGLYAQHVQEVSNVSQQLTSDMASKLLKKAEGDFDLLTELAELNSTARLFIDAYKDFEKRVGSISRVISGLRKKKRSASKNKSQSRASQRKLRNSVGYSNQGSEFDRMLDGILVGQYGILPLYYSYKDFVTLLEQIRKNKKRYRYKFSEVVKHNEGQFANLMSIIMVTGTVRVDNIDKKAKWKRLMFNPFQTVWEKIPYSFVIDWFSNLGDVLHAAGVATNPLITYVGSVGCKVVHAYTLTGSKESVNDKKLVTATHRDLPPFTYVASETRYTPEQVASYKEVGSRFVRTVLSPRIVNPYFSLKAFEAKHAVISAALLNQFRKR